MFTGTALPSTTGMWGGRGASIPSPCYHMADVGAGLYLSLFRSSGQLTCSRVTRVSSVYCLSETQGLHSLVLPLAMGRANSVPLVLLAFGGNRSYWHQNRQWLQKGHRHGLWLQPRSRRHLWPQVASRPPVSVHFSLPLLLWICLSPQGMNHSVSLSSYHTIYLLSIIESDCPVPQGTGCAIFSPPRPKTEIPGWVCGSLSPAQSLPRVQV